MKLSNKRLAITVSCLLITACHSPWPGQKAPSGQVIATVDGQEITLSELNVELGGVNLTDPKLLKAAQDRALQTIIARKALAKAAKDQGIEKSADYALQRDRADEQLLAQFLQQKAVAAVPAPTQEEAQRFISDNPDLFAQHKIFIVDQIRVQRPADPGILKRLEPLNTLEEVATVFSQQHLQFQRGVGQLDTIALGPQITASVLKLKPGDLFVLPDNNLFLVSQIRDTQTKPLVGQPATDAALAYLKRQRIQEAVGRALGAIVKNASETTVYNPTYAPQKRPIPPAPTDGSAKSGTSSPRAAGSSSNQ